VFASLHAVQTGCKLVQATQAPGAGVTLESQYWVFKQQCVPKVLQFVEHESHALVLVQV